VKLIIPSIGVDASVMNLGLCPTSQWGDYCAGIPKNGLATPPLTGPLAQDAGWWSGGAAPGQDGPAVIAGHVNSRAEGNLVFASLGKLRRGDPVEVQLADGVQVTFTVTATEEVAKNAFPTQDVYGATSDPELRLITCGGVFDPSTGHYDSNLIVFAAEVAS
jgi:LPXTG-site transpeptidase (sortase) family protein